MSGFIMYHVYGSWFEDNIQKSMFWKYMKARFARIYPLHFVTLLYVIGLSIVLRMNVDFSQLPHTVQKVFGFESIPTSLLLIQAWGMHLEAPWNTPAWSISVEWFLYLLFPFLLAFLAKYRATARWILGLVIIGSLLLIMYYLQPLFQGF